MRIVVLGGPGFVGRHIVNELETRVNRSDLDLTLAGRTRPEWGHPGRFVEGDRKDPAFIRELMGLKPHFWFDLALFEPVEMEDLAAAWSKEKSVRLFSFAGSVAEYGLSNRLELPVPESVPLRGAGPYSKGKADAWKVAEAAHRRHRFPAFWAVLPQLWGPGDSHGRDSSYVRCIMEGSPMFLRGNGRTLMPDGYVETVAAAMVHMGLNLHCTGLRANVAGMSLLTPLSFVKWTAEALGRPGEIVHLAHRDLAEAEAQAGREFRPVFGDYDFALDLTRLRNTRFQQRLNARRGVEKTALWHAQQGSPASSDFDPSPRFLLDRFGPRP